MNFISLLTKINNRLEKIYTSPLGDLALGAQEISDHLVFLESQFPADFKSWWETLSATARFKVKEIQVAAVLKSSKLTYTLVPELNKVFIKDEHQHVVKEVSLSNLDGLLKKQLDIKSTDENFYVLKSLFSKNQRLEVIALAEGLT